MLQEEPDGPLRWETLVAAGLEASSTAEVRTLEYRQRVNNVMPPGMPAEERDGVKRFAAANSTINRLIMFWWAVERLLGPDARKPPPAPRRPDTWEAVRAEMVGGSQLFRPAGSDLYLTACGLGLMPTHVRALQQDGFLVRTGCDLYVVPSVAREWGLIA